MRPDPDPNRWARLIAVACPVCGVEVLTIGLSMVWCASCPSTPQLEPTAT